MDMQKELEIELDHEGAKTRKMLEDIPDGADFAWKPHPKSMSLGGLAGHVTDMAGDWGLMTLTKDKVEFAADHKWEQWTPASRAELLEKFDTNLTQLKTALAGVSPEKWDQNWQFIYGGHAWLDQPRYQIWREAVINHLIHHRAQLGVYLRLLDAKVPGSYGPSADEM